MANGRGEIAFPGAFSIFICHAHFIQYRFHLFFRYPILFQKNVAKEPVGLSHNGILHLLRERALDLTKGYVVPINGYGPEVEGSHARG